MANGDQCTLIVCIKIDLLRLRIPDAALAQVESRQVRPVFIHHRLFENVKRNIVLLLCLFMDTFLFF